MENKKFKQKRRQHKRIMLQHRVFAAHMHMCIVLRVLNAESFFTLTQCCKYVCWAEFWVSAIVVDCEEYSNNASLACQPCRPTQSDWHTYVYLWLKVVRLICLPVRMPAKQWVCRALTTYTEHQATYADRHVEHARSNIKYVEMCMLGYMNISIDCCRHMIRFTCWNSLRFIGYTPIYIYIGIYSCLEQANCHTLSHAINILICMWDP